jgi:hypothetical protein
VIETAAGSKFLCKAESDKGEYRETGSAPSTKEVQGVVITFTGCGLPFSAQCKSKGAPVGDFITAKLSGRLGYVSGKGTKASVVGQELHPEGMRGLFLAMECQEGAIKFEIREGSGKGGDCIIAETAHVNEMRTFNEELFSGSGGVQSPQHLEGSSHLCNLESRVNGGVFERATLAFNTTITNEEALEIKA